MNSAKSYSILWLAISAMLCLCLVVFSSHRLESAAQAKTQEEHVYLPSEKYANFISIGHRTALASLIWPYALIKQGDAYLANKEYQYLAVAVDLCSRLDSLFYTPYYFLSALTPTYQNDTTDFPPLRRGVAAFPDDWRLALLFAMRLDAVGRSDNASQIMLHFSTDPSVPPHIQRVHRTFSAKGKPTQIALSIYLEDYLKPEYATFRAGLEARIIGVFENSLSLKSVAQQWITLHQQSKVTTDQLIDALLTLSLNLDEVSQHKQ